MLLKINTSDEGSVYRFDYEDWEIIVTSVNGKSQLSGIAISKINEDAPVYFATIRRRSPLDFENDIAKTVGELARQIAVNFVHNCLDDLEDERV